MPVCINVVGHPAEAWLELPEIARGKVVDWTGPKGTMDKIICDKLESILKKAISGDPCGNVSLERRFKMIGYWPNKNFYYRIQCEKRESLDLAIKSCSVELTDLFSGTSPVWRETEIDPVTKMFVVRGWERSGWLELPGEYTNIDEPPIEINSACITGNLRWIDKTSKTRPTIHLYLHANNIKPVPKDLEPKASKVSPLVLYIDFEAIPGKLSGFPKAKNPGDIVYMCSMLYAVAGSSPDTWTKFCICIGRPSMELLNGVTVISVDTEEELYQRLGESIRDTNPDVISGYNIHGFDLKYMETRLATWGMDFPDISRLPGKRSSFDTLRGPRGARYTNIKSPGRIVLDMFLYLVKNTSRQELPSFSLKNVVHHYLKDYPQKIELGYQDQFRMYFRYLLGAPDGPEGLGRIAEYCVRDVEVLPALFDNRAVWQNCVQFSNVLGSTIQTVAVAGQVERLCPFLYANVRRRDTVMEVNSEVGNVKFEGGLVHLSSRGFHRNVVIGDFASLYPSLMISLNLCWTTRVREIDTLNIQVPNHVTELEYNVRNTPVNRVVDAIDSDDDPVSDNDSSDSDSDVASEDDVGVDEETAKQIRKAKKSMALKEDFSARSSKVMYVSSSAKLGIIPEALSTLLDGRAHIRKVIIPQLQKDLKSTSDPELVERLEQMLDDADKRQNIMKLCANSIYGIMGANAPYADPFVGMTTTAEGRAVIQKSTNLILDNNKLRKHVYTDTDSSMIEDPNFDAYPTSALVSEVCMNLLGIIETLPDWASVTYKQICDEWCSGTVKLLSQWLIPLVEAKSRQICKIPDNAAIYGKPMKFEYEAFVISGIWVAKKFYIARIINDEGKIKLKQRGVLLRRSDYPTIVKNIYGDVCFGLLDGKPMLDVMKILADGIERIFIGKDLTFEECAISSDFKSLAEYKQATCKMAILAKNALEMNVPLQENMRVDYVMLAPPGQLYAQDSIILKGGSNSAHLATREMVGDRHIDREHYYKVLVSHIDKIMACVLPPNKRLVIIKTKFVSETYGFDLDPVMTIYIRQCNTCKRELDCYIGRANNVLSLKYSCEDCDTVFTGVRINKISHFSWDLSTPLASFGRLYKGFLSANKQMNLYDVRKRALDSFRWIISRGYDVAV